MVPHHAKFMVIDSMRACKTNMTGLSSWGKLDFGNRCSQWHSLPVTTTHGVDFHAFYVADGNKNMSLVVVVSKMCTYLLNRSRCYSNTPTQLRIWYQETMWNTLKQGIIAIDRWRRHSLFALTGKTCLFS